MIVWLFILGSPRCYMFCENDLSRSLTGGDSYRYVCS